MKNDYQLYLVSSPSGRKLHIRANSSNQAKRIFCKEYGFRPSDSWCGVSSLSSHKLTPAEVKAWGAQEETNRTTAVFIKGMLDICAKAHAEGVAV